MVNFKFGVDYYPEHWPEERLQIDAKLMNELGIKVVRMAEFAWHKMEPEEGRYNLDWLERAVNVLGSYGICTVLGTPSAAPPAWLVRKYSEIQPEGPDGIKRRFGGRHHDCQSSPIYRSYVKKIVTAMAERFKDNSNVVGWQIDNEFGNSHDDLCMCDSCADAFRKWLKMKYCSIDKLNKDWGTCFWSQEYNVFDEIEPPRKTATGANPSQLLDWKRFHSDLICEFSAAQSEIIRRLCPEKHFITHNCMGFSDVVSYYDLSKQLDFISNDIYPGGYWRGFDEITPANIGAELDGIRGITGKNFWIMEQQSSITGWETMGRAPKPGQIPLWAVDSVAHGADTIVFFRWRSCSVGTEQYWHGILPNSGIPARAYDEIKGLIDDLAPVMDRFEGCVPKSEVAIVRSYEQGWAMRIQPNARGISYYGQLGDYYEAFYRQNINVDFIEETSDMSKYKLVIAPLQYLMTGEQVKRYEAYVKAGGTLVLTMRTGVKDERNICDTEKSLPCGLVEISGITVTEYDPLSEHNVKIEFLHKNCGENNEAGKGIVEKRTPEGRKWADLLTLNGAEPVALYGSEWYKGEPAVSVNRYGNGKVYYVGTEPNECLMDELTGLWISVCDVCKNTTDGISVEDGVEVCCREGNDRKWYFVLNHTGETKKMNVSADFEQIAGEVDKSALQPYGYVIYEKEIQSSSN